MREAAPLETYPLPGGADFSAQAGAMPRVWAVGALCHAVADTLEARFNPVAVRGEITGFSRAASGHCYFSLKDANGQIRCAMFRRAASGLNFNPRDGALVEVRGKLGVYEQRGDLQLVVESMQPAGQGALFEEFLRLKAQLESEGLFDPARKRSLSLSPRGIGVATSLGAAALHDVVSALQRRVPHIPVYVASASVQGVQAPEELVQALSKLYLLAQSPIGTEAENTVKKATKSARRTAAGPTPVIDVILLVRGGGSMEDLWAFNDERVARAMACSPVPIVSGVGHETDFTIADFVADLRAPTPTAAAELCAAAQSVWLGAVGAMEERLHTAALNKLDAQAQRVDLVAQRMGRPSDAVGQQRLHLKGMELNLQHQSLLKTQLLAQYCKGLEDDFSIKIQHFLRRSYEHIEQTQRSLDLLNPQHVLERGYAVLQDEAGHVVISSRAVQPGQRLKASLADGSIAVTAG